MNYCIAFTIPWTGQHRITKKKWKRFNADEFTHFVYWWKVRSLKIAYMCPALSKRMGGILKTNRRTLRQKLKKKKRIDEHNWNETSLNGNDNSSPPFVADRLSREPNQVITLRAWVWVWAKCIAHSVPCFFFLHFSLFGECSHQAPHPK